MTLIGGEFLPILMKKFRKEWLGCYWVKPVKGLMII